MGTDNNRDLKAIRRRSIERHEERMGRSDVPPDISSDPELLRAWHSLQLHWMATVPGYRELLKQRVSAARKEQKRQDTRIYNGIVRRDVDQLGREVEGCG